VLIFGGATMAFNASKSSASPAVPAANQAALVRAHAPTIGPADAPVTIVEFLDPACGTCAEFYPLVKQILAANPGRVRLVLRWAPFHPGSQDVVAMLEAARLQDKFFPALEALLGSQDVWSPNHTPQVAKAWAQLENLGLNREKLFADVASAAISRAIAQDIEDARTLNVTMTPEYFVNGKPMPSFGYDQLRQLVDEALKETGR
jgi:protein-disulfide isomerase